MKTFKEWAKEKNYDLPTSEVTPSEKATSENRIRTGLNSVYPDGYVRSQYPHKYFNPHKGTADLDLENSKKKNSKGS